MRRHRRKQVSLPGCSRTTIWRRQKASVRAAYATMESLNASDIDNWLNAVNDDLVRMSSSGAINADCDGHPPPVNSKAYKVKVHKAVDDYQQAVKLQRILEDMSDLPSTDATLPMERYEKRPHKPVFFSECDSDDLEPSARASKKLWSPEPPCLEDQSICLPRTPLKSLDPNHNVPATIACPSFGRPWTSTPTVSPMASTSRTVEEKPSASKSREKPSPLSKEANYGESIMSFLASIKKDTSELKCQIAELQRQNANSTSKIVSQWGIPVDSVDDLASLNERLKNDSYYEQVNVSGTNFGDCTRDMMRQLMTIKVLAQVNMKGAHGRPALAGTKVCSLVIKAVCRKNYPGATTQLIREKMRRCLQRSRASQQESRYELYRDVGTQCNTYDALENSNSSEQFSCD